MHNWGLNADYATINGNLGNLLWDCSGIEVSDQNIQWFQIFNFTFNLSASIIRKCSNLMLISIFPTNDQKALEFKWVSYASKGLLVSQVKIRF